MKTNTSNNKLPKFLYGCPHCLEMYEQGYAKALEKIKKFAQYNCCCSEGLQQNCARCRILDNIDEQIAKLEEEKR